MKYRVVELTHQNGVVTYQPQKRLLWFWINISFDSTDMDATRVRIENHKKKIKPWKVTKRRILTPNS